MKELRWLDRGLEVWLLAGLVLALSACGDSGRSGGHEWQAERDTIGDTIVVRTLAGGVWGDTAELVADVTIGQFDGPDEYMFGNIRSLAAAPDGSIYIFDSHVPALRKYALDGTYVGAFGREGGGPGEYQRPDGGLAVLPDGRVLLRDPGNTRISVYSPEGEYLEGWRIRGGFNTSRRLYADTDGNSYTLILVDPGAAVMDWQLGLVQYGPDGVPRDTLSAPSYDYQHSELVAQRIEDGENTSTSVNGVPFTASVAWVYSPLGYMVGGLSTKYAIDLYKAPDRVLRIERTDWEPVPVLPEEKEERERITTANMRQTQPDWRWNGDPIPDNKPPYRGMYVGARGRIWLLLHQEAKRIESDEIEEARPGEVPSPTWIEPVAFDVFEPDGRYLGMVRAPDDFARYPRPFMRGDTVWAVVRGELEVPYVVRFHIRHPDEET
ncbi:MAG: hypothetical protein HKM89_04125 [Gemmatimonadales bacterium]|nr:hypothetical protein [Gemmatimonadales bacterium]